MIVVDSHYPIGVHPQCIGGTLWLQTQIFWIVPPRVHLRFILDL